MSEEQFQVAVDTTDEAASQANARLLGLDYKVLAEHGGGGWPEVQVTGPYQTVLSFLAEHLGDSQETPLEYLQEFGTKL